jgi:hypothetical protein
VFVWRRGSYGQKELFQGEVYFMWELSRVQEKENFSRDVIIKPDKNKTTLSRWFLERMEIAVLSKKKNVKKQGEWRHGHDLDVPCSLSCCQDKAILSTEEAFGQHDACCRR